VNPCTRPRIGPLAVSNEIRPQSVRQRPDRDNHPSTPTPARQFRRNDRATTPRGRRGVYGSVERFATEAPSRCIKWRSTFRVSRASSCFVGRAAARRCLNGGATIFVAPKSVKISTASASGAPSATRPTSSLNGRRHGPTAEEHNPSSARGLDAGQEHSRPSRASGSCTTLRFAANTSPLAPGPTNLMPPRPLFW